MATVSELGWYPINRIDFCACCGLRRALGTLNVHCSPGQEKVRCIDCFFGPPEPDFVFWGTAVWADRLTPFIHFGQTGDILWDGNSRWFEPHGDIENRIPIEDKDSIHATRPFTPKRYSVADLYLDD